MTDAHHYYALKTIKESGKEKPIAAYSKNGGGDYIQRKPKKITTMTAATEDIQNEINQHIENLDQTLCQRCLPYLYTIREPVADYQAKKGISKDENYTFYDLVTAVGTYMYNSLTAMGSMLCNLLPIFDAVLLITRFIIDKIIEILEADDNDRIMKALLFVVEFIPLFFIIGFIYGFILMPLYALFITVLAKFWNFVY